jgi:hypothetical protein
MNTTPFQRQRAYGLIAIIILIASTLFLLWVITVPAIRATSENRPLPADWTWGTILLFDFGSLIVCGYLCAGPITQLLTNFDDQGIEQPSFPHTKFLRWQDIQTVRNLTTSNIEVIGIKTKICINPNIYKNPRGLIQEIRLRIPESSFPDSNAIAKEILRHKRENASRAALGTILFGIFILLIGNNSVAAIMGVLMMAYGVYKIQRWVKLGRHS